MRMSYCGIKGREEFSRWERTSAMYDLEVGGSMALTQNVNCSNPEDGGGEVQGLELRKGLARGVNLGLIYIERVGEAHLCLQQTVQRQSTVKRS